MNLFLANLFYILIVLVFIGGLVFRYFIRRRSEGKTGWFRLKWGKGKKKETVFPRVKSDEERRLRLEKLKKAKLRYVGEDVSTGVIGVVRDGNIEDFDESKFDKLSERRLEKLESSTFPTKDLAEDVETEVEKLEDEVSKIVYGEDKTLERKSTGGLKRVNKLRPLVQRFVWKEILDRPRADNLDIHWW